MKLRILFGFLLSVSISNAQVNKIVLTNWTLSSNSNIKELAISNIPYEIPNNVHSILFAKENLNPFLFETEHGQLNQFIENTNWKFETSFKFDSSWNSASRIELLFEGIDTYSKIYLNDSLICQTYNMFCSYEIDVKNHLRQNNKLRVEIESPINHHESYLKKSKLKLPSGSETGEMQVSNLTRKAAFQFGWDWSQRYVTMGIWKPVYIKLINDFYLSNFNAQTLNIQGENAAMKIEFDLYSSKKYESVIVEFMDFEMQMSLEKGENKIMFYHHISHPKLWYPNGYGDPHIYRENLIIRNQNFEKLFQEKVSFGIRKVELVNKKDEIGTSFYFKINDQPIFCKGANYVLQSVFLTDIKNEQIDSLLSMVKSANMNMLRVWGGGIYQSDYFYELCNERGIMIWQDFMFANSLYPKDSVFNSSVSQEINDNVLRLRNHPSIVLWCGNNEIEVAWNNWGWQKQFGYSKNDSIAIWDNYKYLFDAFIPFHLKKIDDSRPYISSTPQSNWGKPEYFNHGAMHYWGVWHGNDNIDDFKNNVGRFMVEYGFQSYPELSTLLHYLPENQINFDSASFKNLQKSYVGNKRIELEIERLLKGTDNIYEYLKQTQEIQSLALANAIKSHRFSAPHCMGTLFWQLNDSWPGASWSVIDYDLNPKRAYHEVKKWFSPVIADIEKNDSSLVVKAVSDNDFKGELVMNIFDSKKDKLIKSVVEPISLHAIESKIVWEIDKKLFKKLKSINLVCYLSIIGENNAIIFNHEVKL